MIQKIRDIQNIRGMIVIIDLSTTYNVNRSFSFKNYNFYYKFWKLGSANYYVSRFLRFAMLRIASVEMTPFP